MAQNTPIPVGTVVQDTYEILAFLGAGGMGSTYKARHIAMGHDVCVKVIHADLLQDSRVLDLFKREATLMRDLSQSGTSDAIVRIETLLRDASGVHYLIMEFIDGKPLSHYIEKGARLAEADVLTLGRRLLEALKEVHGKNIVHRDISPDNIMVPDDTILKAKILDFGVATDVVGTEKSILGDSFAGKISYASPEQLGLFDGQVSAKSDIYSLGLVLLAVAGIEPPGKGSMASAVEMRKTDIRVEHKNLSAKTSRLIEGLLKADPKDRVASLDVVTPPGPAPQPKPAQKKKSLVPLLAGAVVVVAVGTAAFLGLGPGEPEAVEIAQTGAAPDESSVARSDAEQSTPPAPEPEPTAEESAPETPAPADTQPRPAADVPDEPETASAPRDVAAARSAGADIAGPPPAPEQPRADADEEIAALAPSQGAGEPSPAPTPPALIVEPKPDDTPTVRTSPSPPLDPTELARQLIERGGKENTRRAYDVLLAHMSDPTAPQLERAEAAALIGWMFDPKYHTTNTSPFDAPSVEDALKAYRFARKLGITNVQRDISRLAN